MANGIARMAKTPFAMTISHRPSAILAVALLVCLAPARPAAHDIPNDVTVQTFLKPEGQRLRLLVRVPLGAMRDMDYPKPRGTTNADLLDLSRAEQSLRDAATLWLSDTNPGRSGFIRLSGPPDSENCLPESPRELCCVSRGQLSARALPKCCGRRVSRCFEK